MSTLVNIKQLLDDWQDELDDGNSSPTAKPRPVQFKHDPIACACASYRISQEHPGRRWTDLDSVVVWQDDIDQAQALRQYYRERLVMSALKSRDGNISPFRRKLGALVTDQLEIMKHELGLLYRLPYFYAEDRAIDYVVANSADNAMIAPMPQDSHPMTMTFQPLHRVFRSRRSGEHHVFYWVTHTRGVAFSLSVAADNPLLAMIDSLFSRDHVELQSRVKPVSFRGYYPNRWHYQMYDMRLP